MLGRLFARHPRGTAAAPSEWGSLEVLGTWFGRHTALYASASAITLVLGFVQVAVVTHFLEPAEYGRAGLLLVFAGFLTIAYTMLTLNGTFMGAYGAAEDEEVAGDDVPWAKGDAPRVLGSGLVATLAIATAGTLIVVPLAPTIGRLLLGSPSSSLVLLAVASGGFGALWRLLQNIPRMELRPGSYVLLSAVRPLLVMAGITLLVSTGHGVGGVVAGTALGSAGAVLVAAITTRRSYRLTLDWQSWRAILRAGLPYVPIILSFWLVQNGDLFALSRFASQHDVGLYRLAGRVGSVAGYGVFAFLTAWIPLRRTVAYAAATEEHGLKVSGALFTYFFLLGMGIVLALAVGADVLVRIAPPAYASAAPLIPLIAAGFVVHGLFVATNRGASFPHKRVIYVLCAVLSAACFAALVPVLVTTLGAAGAALSVILGFGLGTVVMLVLSQRGQRAMELQTGRLIKGAIATLGCFAIARSTVLTGSAGPILELASLLLFPVLLVVTGAVPREEARGLARIFRGAMGRRPKALDVAGLAIAEPEAVDPAPSLESPEEPGETLDSEALRLQWRRTHGLGLLRTDPLAAETHFGEHVRYFLYVPENARPDALVVCFSSARGDSEPGYSYVGALHDLPCPTLFVRPAGALYLGERRSTEVREAVASLLASVVTERQVPRAGVICCGTSLGGGAALSQAAGGGFGHAVVGVPIVMIGETLLGQFGGKQGAEMAKLLAGGAEDDREYLNSVVFERLLRASADTRVHLLGSKNDPLHELNLAALKRAVGLNRRLSLDVTLSDYGSHAEIRTVFPGFMRETVSQILSLQVEAESQSRALTTDATLRR